MSRKTQTLSDRSAYLLIFHGSRHPNYNSVIHRLVNSVSDRLANLTLINHKERVSVVSSATKFKLSSTVASSQSRILIDVAVLEFGQFTLAQKIVNFAQKAIASNYKKLVILPVFLAAGIHVTEDIPQEIYLAKQQLGNSIELELLDYVGSNEKLIEVIDRQFKLMSASGRILLAHGSRLPQGNVASEHLANRVNARATYWKIPPDLATTVQLLANQNLPSLAIVPYFLFSGRITETIAKQTAELQLKYPQTKLLLAQPFGMNPEFINLIAKSIGEGQVEGDLRSLKV